MARTHDLSKIPEGYRLVMWADVEVRAIVYLQSMIDGKATGPHQVIDPQHFTLRNISTNATHTFDDELLLYKEGPRVVALWINGQGAGIYSDVPLEVVLCRSNLLFDLKEVRPRPLDALPDDYKREIDRVLPVGWMGMYGKWEITSVTIPVPHKAVITFGVTNRLAINALMVELTNNAQAFSVRPTEHGTEFSVSPDVWDWVTQNIGAVGGD